MRQFRAWCLPWCAALAGCGDITVQSHRVAPSVPAQFLGEWVGSWSSAGTPEAASGGLTLSVQSFAGQPVFGVVLDNPCLMPGVYEVFTSETTLELRTGGAVVLTAVLGADRSLQGSYQCASDHGTLVATWQRELAPIVDLGGDWEGSLVGTSTLLSRLQLQLTQAVVNGQLVVDGTLALPDLGVAGVPVSGTARFRAGVFELWLQTPTGVEPGLRLAGLGDSTARELRDAVLSTAPGTPLPFLNARLFMAWARR